MTEPVHMLVSCPEPKYFPAATLVFRTLRTGFPDARVRAWVRMADEGLYKVVSALAAKLDVEVRCCTNETIHDRWVRDLIQGYQEPFWICDTDVIFWTKVPAAPSGHALAGVRVPSFWEPFTRTQYRERLHTCLMRIDPSMFWNLAQLFFGRFPKMPFIPHTELICQQWQPERNGAGVTFHFYDTLAMAWHAFGGQDFTQAHIDSFSHLNCATYAHMVAPHLDFDILAAHEAVYADINQARNLWPRQFDWFKAHATQPKVFK